MSDIIKKNTTITPPYKDSIKAHISNFDTYTNMYTNSIKHPDSFWGKQAEKLAWIKKWDTISNNDFTTAKINWFDGGKLNVTYNCLDRHVESGHGNETAIIWEGNDPKEDTTFTYSELLVEVCKFSNVLKSKGVQKGDRICIYMQMIPELAISMLACARIGAIHSIVFGAFSPDALRDRINDSSCKILITQDTGIRGIKQNIPMKANADIALEQTPSIETTIVVERTGNKVQMDNKRDIWWC